MQMLLCRALNRKTIESEGGSQEGLLEGTYQQGPDEEDLTDEEGLQ